MQESFSLGETIKARALTSWGLVTCRGLRVLRALRDLGRWWFSWATAGARPYATPTLELFSRRFFDLLVRSLQQKRKMCSRVPTYIAPRAHVMPSTESEQQMLEPNHFFLILLALLTRR